MISYTSSSLPKIIENGILLENLDFICCILGCVLYLSRTSEILTFPDGMEVVYL